MPAIPPLDHPRIVRLERRLRRVQFLACGSGLIAATLLLSGYHLRAYQVLQAERLELVTPSGVRQAILRADTLGFTVTILDGRGAPAGTLRVTDEPRLTLETGKGHEVAGLGAPKVHHLTE
jgi:hypothetical protein